MIYAGGAFQVLFRFKTSTLVYKSTARLKVASELGGRTHRNVITNVYLYYGFAGFGRLCQRT